LIDPVATASADISAKIVVPKPRSLCVNGSAGEREPVLGATAIAPKPSYVAGAEVAVVTSVDVEAVDDSGSIDVVDDLGAVVVVDDEVAEVVGGGVGDGSVVVELGRSIGTATAITGPPSPSSKIVVGGGTAAGDVVVVDVDGSGTTLALARCAAGVVVEVVVVASVVVVVDDVVGCGRVVTDSDDSGSLPTSCSALTVASLVAGSPACDAVVPVGAEPGGFDLSAELTGSSVEPGELLVVPSQPAVADESAAGAFAASVRPGSATPSAAAAMAASTTSGVTRPPAILR
jgi:hypothetical protein